MVIVLLGGGNRRKNAARLNPLNKYIAVRGRSFIKRDANKEYPLRLGKVGNVYDSAWAIDPNPRILVKELDLSQNVFFTHVV